jgi:hypothetical protein
MKNNCHFKGLQAFFLFILISCSQLVSAQPNTCTPTTTSAFNLAASASVSNGFIQLTSATNNQYGQAWSSLFYDFSKPFSYSFSVYLGSNDAGADGLAFVMRPAFSNATGAPGNGLGYSGMTPSLEVEFDTYQNAAPENDPAQDHIALHSKGVSASSGLIGTDHTVSNIEDGAWHDVLITWSPATNNFVLRFDGNDIINITRNILQLDLNNSKWVIIGFTASTGGANNVQSVCSKTITATSSSIACTANSEFNLAGNASLLTAAGGYIQLTPNTAWQSGQAWSKNQITLASNFNQKFRAFFGANDGGADGFAFVLRSPGTAIKGTDGEGLGYGAISPSFVIEFDTYSNSGIANTTPYTGISIADPGNDHLAYHRLGNYTSTGRIGNNIDLGNIEDNAWHDVEIDWNASTKTLSTYLDGVLKRSEVRDIVSLDLLGNPLVYFGFTASTGTLTNEQAVCVQEITATIPASLAKSVLPTAINDGGTAAFTWSISNSASGAGVQTGIAFTDALPSGLKIAAVPAVTFSGWQVNPVVTATAGGTSVQVSGGTIAAGAVATISVNITNASGQFGTCPNTAFTNASTNISDLSNNLNNKVGDGPCLTVNSCAANAGTIIRN